jgi:hypothetical protein
MFSSDRLLARRQGACSAIAESNGKRDEGYNEPGGPIDPSKDARIPFGLYVISWSPLDGSTWGAPACRPHKGEPTFSWKELVPRHRGFDCLGLA